MSNAAGNRQGAARRPARRIGIAVGTALAAAAATALTALPAAASTCQDLRMLTVLENPTTLATLCEKNTGIRATATSRRFKPPAGDEVLSTMETTAKKAGLPGLARTTAILGLGNLGGAAAGGNLPALPTAAKRMATTTAHPAAALRPHTSARHPRNTPLRATRQPLPAQDSLPALPTLPDIPGLPALPSAPETAPASISPAPAALLTGAEALGTTSLPLRLLPAW
ncbi:hypothetical protein HNP84_007448 [Thermocatellispora tengchongensis]|uniref:Uncharacterized protein n=1 Tax=Thermocatellispora tengchongensis TaxID=1073253 RepID=A0A840PFY1_9ACTN|nr:hypothetical protein [Thermocatellispora tengchongensis]MBB5137696.1 hypothetical protein [Thermocatellispora tengchongensis]